MDNITPPTVSLFLRTDGSLLLVKGDNVVEIQLTPRQLLELGMDSLRTALSLDPGLGGAIADVLDHTYVLPHEGQQCAQH